MAAEPAPERDIDGELETLRARIRALEAERLELQTRTNETVAAAQKRVYWLDRWQVDLNALMERPGADAFRATLRGARSVKRFVTRLRRPSGA